MISKFDGISEPSSQEASNEFSYQNGNNKFHHWLTDTVSSSYNRTANKLSKCKRYLIWKWKILLVGLCLWLSVLVPLILLWFQVVHLRIQVSSCEKFQGIESTVETIQYEVEENYWSTTTADDDYYLDSSTISSTDTDGSSESSSTDSSTSTTVQSALDNVEKLIDEKLLLLKEQIECMKGEVGPVGPPGLDGEHGLNGQHGMDGLPGMPGFSIKGEKGDPGIEGLPGLPGLPGLKGERGYPGAKGDTGAMGASGRSGQKGEQGSPGLAGIKGEKGDRSNRFGWGG